MESQTPTKVSNKGKNRYGIRAHVPEIRKLAREGMKPHLIQKHIEKTMGRPLSRTTIQRIIYGESHADQPGAMQRKYDRTPPLTKAQRRALLTLYKTGKYSHAQIAGVVGCSKQTVVDHVLEHIPKAQRRRKLLTPTEVQTIIKGLRAGLSDKKIAKEVGCAWSHVNQIRHGGSRVNSNYGWTPTPIHPEKGGRKIKRA